MKCCKSYKRIHVVHCCCSFNGLMLVVANSLRFLHIQLMMRGLSAVCYMCFY